MTPQTAEARLERDTWLMTHHPDRRLALSNTDTAFDSLLPDHLRCLSHRYWTPVVRTQVAHVEQRLATLRDRVRVVTLDGFGGAMPPSYELVYHERISVTGSKLALWVQHAGSLPRLEYS